LKRVLVALILAMAAACGRTAPPETKTETPAANAATLASSSIELIAGPDGIKWEAERLDQTELERRLDRTLGQHPRPQLTIYIDPGIADQATLPARQAALSRGAVRIAFVHNRDGEIQTGEFLTWR